MMSQLAMFEFAANLPPHRVVMMAMLTLVLVMAAVTDWRSGKVPNALTYPAIMLGLVWAIAAGWWVGGASGAAMEGVAAMVALGAAVVPFVLIFAMGGLGGGDVKLMAAVGAISGDWRVVLATAVYAFIIGAVMAVGVMVGRGLVRQTAQRLALSAMLGTTPARLGLDGPEGTARHATATVPFAIAIAVGGIVAGLELLLGVATPWAGFAG